MLTSQTANPQESWQPLLEAWWQRFLQATVTVEQLRAELGLDQVDQASLLPVSIQIGGRKGSGSLKRSLGRHLAKMQGRPVGAFVIHDGGRDSHIHIRKWRLERPEAITH